MPKNNSIVTEGKKAPAFTLLNQDNQPVSLKDFKGNWLVFYFYPKDNTPGCTTEAIDFTSLLKEFHKAGAKIVGVSPDSTVSHCRFIEKKDLKIELLSDPDHQVIEAYGAWQLKKFMGREFMGVVRSTWLISPEGNIEALWSPVKVKEHALEVLKKLRELI